MIPVAVDGAQVAAAALDRRVLEDEFRRWMKQQKKPSGGSYALDYITTCTNTLRTAPAKLQLTEPISDNLFSYASAQDFAEALRIIRQAPNFTEVNQAASNGAFSAAMEHYLRFLKELNSGDYQKMPSQAHAATEDVPIKRYWLFAPGRSGSMWDDFYENGTVAISYDNLSIGDLSQYGSRSEMAAAIKQQYGDDNTSFNVVKAFWQFMAEMEIGDVVYAKQGLYKIIGRGVVTSDYYYDPTQGAYPHRRNVDWTNVGEWDYPGTAPQKTLTDITLSTGIVEQLELAMRGEALADEQVEDSPVYPAYNEADFLQDVYLSAAQYETLKELLRRKKNIILQGPPGVGKTFAAQRLAFAIMGEKDTSRVKMVQFHQSYSYEDFVMGYRPDGSGFVRTDGPFYRFCKAAEEREDQPFFFIIDEINRGNISKIFGELLMLIENDKRGTANAIKLLYKDEQFSVPDNVHIIGMMNTADRSLAVMDYALRRRFAFFELASAFQSAGFRAYQAGLHNPKFDALVQVVESLNREISTDLSLGPGFQIGHSYFCTSEVVDDLWLNSVIDYELLPLLQEYWFDEPTKVAGWEARLRGAVNG